ncbi:GON-4-like protein [Caerostris extrusa]|uniref:GON-4-like protein n=1 Tax=Caerostris extrusa TaxID=172846 RepID=A0AAV4TJ34_CAEEX|nr:GON-4-like protein [Caerostris extrusa]
MRMHVQLATQSYLLSHGNPKLTFMCETAKTYLNELKMFSSGPIANNQQSAFYAHNLDGALDIIKKFDLKIEEDINTEKYHEYKITSLRTIPKHVRKTLATSKVFIYPELLPEHGFREILFSCYKALFCTAEDNLIAIGLEEFSYADDPLDLIRHFLLPMKKKHQIINHINLCKKEDPSKNAIAFYYKYRKPIEFKRVIRMFNPNNVKSPEEYPPENLPEWMKKYSKLAMPKKLKKELIPEKKVKFILPRIPVKIEIAKQFHVPQHPLATLCPLKIKPPCEKAKQEIILPKWRTLPSSETNNHLDSQKTVSKQKNQNESPSKKSRKRHRKSKISKRNQPRKLTKISSVLNEHLSKTDTAKVVKKVRTKKVNKHEKNSVSSSETNSHLDLQGTVSKQKKQEDSTKSRKKLGNPKISKRNQSCKLNEISSVLNEPLSKTNKSKVVKKTRTKKVIEHEKNSISSSETNSHLDSQETVSKQKEQNLMKNKPLTKSQKSLGKSENFKISKRNKSFKSSESSFVLNEPSLETDKIKIIKEIRTKDNKVTSITNFDASQEFSSMTEPSLKIVTSQDKDDFLGDSDNEHVSTALCNNFPSTNALCEANEDAVLPPSTNSAKKKIPPDFSNIKLVINSDSKKKSIEDVDENDCPSGQKMKWSMENDMMIISNCEKYGINENAFQRSATCIHSTTTEEIKNRFIHLLKSLQKK